MTLPNYDNEFQEYAALKQMQKDITARLAELQAPIKKAIGKAKNKRTTWGLFSISRTTSIEYEFSEACSAFITKQREEITKLSESIKTAQEVDIENGTAKKLKEKKTATLIYNPPKAVAIIDPNE